MEGTKKHDVLKDNDAVECLLFKLILSQTLVGEECKIKKGRLSQEFWDSHKISQNRDGKHNKR